MALFPSYLILANDGFTVEPDDASGVYRTPMEGGLPKQLARSSRTLVRYTVKYMATSLADFNSFKTFVRTTLRNGADWFTWTDPTDSVAKLARIPNGKYQAEPWTPTLNRWLISFTIEVWGA